MPRKKRSSTDEGLTPEEKADLEYLEKEVEKQVEAETVLGIVPEPEKYEPLKPPMSERELEEHAAWERERRRRIAEMR